MFSLNKWLKTPDVDGRYQPIVRDFQAAIPEVLDALPRKYFQQPVSWMTRIFHQFDDVSLMAAQGIESGWSLRLPPSPAARSSAAGVAVPPTVQQAKPDPAAPEPDPGATPRMRICK